MMKIQRTQTTLTLCILAALGLFAVPFAQANPLTYDADTGTTGAQDGAGAGWDGSTANWWNGSTDNVWPDTTDAEAIFGAGSGAAGAVTVSGTRTLNKLTFLPPGSGTYALSGGTLSFADTTPTIEANVDAEVGSILAGSAGLIKTGAGTLTVSGANSFSGDTTIDAGTWLMTGGSLANSTRLLVQGGTFTQTDGAVR